MKGALDVHRALLALDVPHEVVRLPTPVAGADELPRVLGLAVGCLAVRCYTVTRTTGRSFVAVLVPAGAAPDPGALLEALGATAVRTATAGEINAATEFAAGLVSPVALPPSVELLADTAVGTHDVVYTAIGEPGLALGIRVRDLLVAVGAKVANLTTGRLPVLDGERHADVVDLDTHMARRAFRRPG